MAARAFNINNFDLIRLFAATQVLILHSIAHLQTAPYPQWIKVIAQFRGVPIFFVISGFLLAASIEEHPGINNYFRNRILRIYPGLWGCIVLSIPVIWCTSGISFINWEAVRWFVSQCPGIIYTPSFLKSYGFGSYNGSLWTIPVELQFYFLLPVLYYINGLIAPKETTRTIIIAILLLACTLVAYLVTSYNYTAAMSVSTIGQKLLRYSFIPHVYLFLLGILLQRLKVNTSEMVRNKGLWWVLAYGLYCYYVPAGAARFIAGNILLGICTISVAYSRSAWPSKILKGNDISYGVYIYHGLVLGVLVQLKVTGSMYHVLVVLAISYCLGFLSWRLIEKPFIKLKRKAFRPFPNAAEDITV